MPTKHPLQRCGGARDDTTIHINFLRHQLMALLRSIASRHPRKQQSADAQVTEYRK